jgi:NTP pyrophosphatase (non-canonical NTP hydrolase)
MVDYTKQLQDLEKAIDQNKAKYAQAELIESQVQAECQKILDFLASRNIDLDTLDLAKLEQEIEQELAAVYNQVQKHNSEIQLFVQSVSNK